MKNRSKILKSFTYIIVASYLFHAVILHSSANCPVICKTDGTTKIEYKNLNGKCDHKNYKEIINNVIFSESCDDISVCEDQHDYIFNDTNEINQLLNIDLFLSSTLIYQTLIIIKNPSKFGTSLTNILPPSSDILII